MILLTLLGPLKLFMKSRTRNGGIPLKSIYTNTIEKLYNRYYNIHYSHQLNIRIKMLSLKSPFDMTQEIAKKAQEKRLELNLSQKTLSEKSGVSYGTLKNFEQKGQISLESLLKIALALGEMDTFENLFSKPDDTLPASIDELLADKQRKRGRK